ncbi:UNVERIFIED_CONTAM: hypothetical protein Slati_3661700 [Sesamum latifolium]|uniref:Uncharacterized protein n=1 Tax=Sesamum latifolium TaxID=2727402 RepID=A0AAW2U0F8_9LAMI
MGPLPRRETAHVFPILGRPRLDADPSASQRKFICQTAALRGEILSRPPRKSAQTQGDVHKRKLEDRVERLLEEVTKLKDSRKEVVGRYQQAKREVKNLQREVKTLKEDHAEELQMMADQVHKEFPDTDEGKNFLSACWASRLAAYKKSEDYKQDGFGSWTVPAICFRGLPSVVPGPGLSPNWGGPVVS